MSSPAARGVELRFNAWLAEGRSPATVGKVLGALRSAWAIVGDASDERGVLDLLRTGMRVSAPVVRAPPDGVRIAELLRAWLRLPVGSAVERRDRAMVLCAIFLGARPRDLTCLMRDDPELLRISSSGEVRLRFASDKGSRLSGAAASGFIFVPFVARFPLGDVLRQVLDDVSSREVVRSEAGAPLFVCLDGRRRGRPLTVDTVSNVLSRFLAFAGLAGDAAHARQIRAYAASSAYELGVDAHDICDHFRWRDVTTFRQHYRRHSLEVPLDALPRGLRRGSLVVHAFDLAFGRDIADDHGTHPPSFVPRALRPRPGTGSGRSFNAATPSESERSDASDGVAPLERAGAGDGATHPPSGARAI